MYEKNIQNTSILEEHQNLSSNYDDNTLAHRYTHTLYRSLAYRQMMDIYNTKELIRRAFLPFSPPVEKLLDVGCGTGIVTREIIEEGLAKSIVGIDISKSMIDLAIEANKQDDKRYQYLVRDIYGLSLDDIGSTFPVVTAVYVIQYAETVDNLLSMVSAVRRLCSKFFVGVIPNPFDSMDNHHKYTKYGLKIQCPKVPKDGDACNLTFDFDKPSRVTITNYWYNPETYENQFRKAGFRTFEWVPMHVDPTVTDEKKAFFADLSQRGIGFIAGV